MLGRQDGLVKLTGSALNKNAAPRLNRTRAELNAAYSRANWVNF
jgi:hypothetical protein